MGKNRESVGGEGRRKMRGRKTKEEVKENLGVTSSHLTSKILFECISSNTANSPFLWSVSPLY